MTTISTAGIASGVVGGLIGMLAIIAFIILLIVLLKSAITKKVSIHNIFINYHDIPLYNSQHCR